MNYFDLKELERNHPYAYKALSDNYKNVFSEVYLKFWILNGHLHCYHELEEWSAMYDDGEWEGCDPADYIEKG